MDITKTAEFLNEKGYITRGDLKAMGLDKSELAKLVRSGVLRKIGKRRYVPASAKEFDNRALMLISENRIDDALKYMKSCFVIAPKSPRYNYFMLYLAVFYGKFDDIKGYFDVIMNAPATNYQKLHNNFCLYLLSFMINLPEPYGTKAKKLKPEDYVEKDEKVKVLASKQLWTDALTELRKKTSSSFETLLINLLLRKVANFQSAIAHKIYFNIDKREFAEALKFINREADAHPLEEGSERLQIVLEDIVFMEKNNISSTIFASKVDSIDLLLKCRNYKLVRELLKSGKMPVNIESAKGRILLGLIDYAINLRDSLIYGELYNKKDDRPLFDKMQESIEIGNINLSFYYLSKYLKEKGVEEFYYLMENFIKICFDKGDTCAYLGVLEELTPGYRIPIRDYIDAFDNAVASCHFTEARLLLNIIDGAYNHGHSDMDSQELASILEDCKQKLVFASNQPVEPRHIIEPVN